MGKILMGHQTLIYPNAHNLSGGESPTSPSDPNIKPEFYTKGG